MPVKPIKPSEVTKTKTTQLPDEVLEAFNELIAEKFSNGFAEFQQKDAVSLILKKFRANGNKKVSADDLFENSWMDVEAVYRKAGWEVDYDSPAFCETYEPSYTFKRK